MKLTILFLFVGLMQVSASLYSQNTKLNLDFRNARVVDVMEAIENQSEFRFAYSAEYIDMNRKVNVDVKNQSIEKTLDVLFGGTDVKYKVNDRHIMLFLESNEPGGTQQQKPVSGKVTDSSGSPLPGVSVVVKGTTTGTISDANGNYSLSNVPVNGTLQFSFVGMKSQEVVIGNKTSINVTLEEENIGIDEVVAIGYGTQKRQAVTGAVASADLKTYEKVATNNVMELLKGTVAGLNVGEANKAGGVPGFTIRGQNTIGASNAPLLVVDGVIYAGSLNDIASTDIESITVLKDASASAVYGSRSANGVIMIETKKGKSTTGKPNFNLTTSFGLIQEMNTVQVYDAEGYYQRLYDINIDNGVKLEFENAYQYMQEIERNNYLATPEHTPTVPDPYDLFRQNGFNKNISLSISDRTDRVSYYVAGNVIDESGVILNDKFKRYAFRMNLESKITNWLTMGVKSSYSFTSYPDARIYGVGGLSSVYATSPYADIYNEDGSYNHYPQTTTSFINPFWSMADEAYNRTHNLNGIFSAIVKIPWVEGLTYTMNYSNTLRFNEEGSFYGFETHTGLSAKGTGSRNYSRSNTALMDNIVNYKRTFKEKHYVDLTLLYNHTNYESYYENASARGFENDQLGTWRLGAGTTQSVATGGGATEGIGQMARLTYAYNNKYSITGTVRRDGYSAFSANNKYGTFGSAGVNWNISQEGFMKNISTINKLSLRASYGSNGNQSISPYSTLAKIGNSYGFFNGDKNYTYTQYISTLGNSELLWESTTGTNFGIDFAILEQRISGSIDGYFTSSNNMAFSLNLPNISGFSTITANAGEIANKGLEINLSTLNIKKEKFSWTSDFAFSINRNEIVHLLGDADGDGIEDDIISSGLFIGKSLGNIYAYEVAGMWQQEDVDNGTIMSGYKPGHYKISEVLEDGKIDSEDRKHLGNSKENFRWSFTNTFRYGNFSFMAYINSVWGGNGWFLAGNTPWNDGYANTGYINHLVYDYWTPNNTGAEFPRPSYKDSAPVKSTKYYDRSFIRLQKIALTYDFSEIASKIGIAGADLTVSGDNLATYAPHWIGMDASTAQGLTDTSIPSLRTFTTSLTINF